jgi:FkbM family methyltransferase
MIVAGIHLPDTDTHFAGQIAANPRYRGKGTYQWSKLAAALDVCGERRGHAVDVGAHIGLWSRVLSYEFKKVTAFEPIEEYAALFSRNLARRPGVTLNRFGLGAVESDVPFTVSPDGVGTASIDPAGDQRCSIKRLDSLDLAPIDFLKIDAEGYETAVVIGAKRTIQRDKPVILIEQKRKRLGRYGYRPEAGVDLLKSWGAEVAWEDHGDWCLQWPA